MINGNSILGIIPARGGSKGLLRKNIQEVAGKPLIAWTIEESKKSQYIDRLILSSEDKEIIAIAKAWGCNVPFFRPVELAGDETPGIEIVIHAIETLDEKYDFVILLQPTSPLRKAEDIEGAIQSLMNKNVRAVVSVCESDHHPWWSNILPEDGNMKDFLKMNILNKPRQNLPVFYRLNGAIFLAETDYLYKYNGFFGPDTYAYKMPKDRSIDIDTDIDFKLAGLLIEEQG